MLLALASVVFLGSEFLSSRDHILLSQETSLFVASYDSQGDGGGIRPHLHTGGTVSYYWLLVSRNIPSGRTTANKTHPLPSNGCMRTHIESTSCSTGPIFECEYFGRCLEMGLLYFWYRNYWALFA
jgi:hypothetical protein